MVGSSKDVLIIGGILGIVYLAYRGIGGFLKGFTPQLPTLPTINISNPFTQNSPVSTTYPNAPTQDKSFLESIQGGFASQNTTLENYLKLLNENLTKLGTPANPANAPTSPTPIDVILNDKTLTEEQKRKALDILTPTEYSDLSKFNPKGVFGYGILGENQKGISLELARNLNLVGKNANQITAQQKKFLSEIDPTENFNKIALGTAGNFQIQQFFNAFGIPFTHTVKSGTQKSNQIIQNEQTAKIKNIPFQSSTLTQSGGSGFIGGKTTFGDNIVDTLSEVLKIFPTLTAGQARDALNQYKGLTPADFMKINPDVRNLSGDLKQNQIFLNASRGLSGQTPQQISNLLMRHLA